MADNLMAQNGNDGIEPGRRMSAAMTGGRGEKTAAAFLEARGYRIIERNFRGERYEIDIIAEQKNTIVFCEVKTARSRAFGPATEWVTPVKISHIAQAANEYIASHDISGRAFRFDVIGITISRGRTMIDHIENAFSAPEEP